jgi:hypothetical protein
LRRLPVIAKVVPSSPILITLMIEAIRSSETSILTRIKQLNIPEDGIHFSMVNTVLQDLRNTIITIKLEVSTYINNFFYRSYNAFKKPDIAIVYSNGVGAGRPKTYDSFSGKVRT